MNIFEICTRTLSPIHPTVFRRVAAAPGMDCGVHDARSAILYRPQHENDALVAPAGEGGAALGVGEDRVPRVRHLLRQPHNPSGAVRAPLRDAVPRQPHHRRTLPAPPPAAPTTAQAAAAAATAATGRVLSLESTIWVESWFLEKKEFGHLF